MGARGPRRGSAELPFRTDPARQAKFLAELESCGSLIEASRRCSPHADPTSGALSTIKNWIRDSPEFAARVQESLDAFRDSLVREAVRRGRDGYDGRPIHYKGEIVGYEKQYSDALLLAELRKHHEGYREKVEHDHRVQIQPSGAWAISTDDLAALQGHPDAEQLKANLREVMDAIRDHRREVARIEHRPAEVVAVEDAEVEDEPEYAEFDLGPGELSE